MPSREDDQQAEIERLREELAKAHADLQLARTVLARQCIDLATVTARLRIAERAIEYLA